MGLDQTMYTASKANTDYEDPSRRQLAYRRKHPNLQGWMERLWLRKLGIPLNEKDRFIEDKFPPETFNGVELELTWQDLDNLEKDIISGRMAALNTTGFFFGDPSDDYYRDQDLQFIIDAKAEVFLGLKVFYTSSW